VHDNGIAGGKTKLLKGGAKHTRVDYGTGLTRSARIG
jgi:hypothetical protein